MHDHGVLDIIGFGGFETKGKYTMLVQTLIHLRYILVYIPVANDDGSSKTSNAFKNNKINLAW